MSPRPLAAIVSFRLGGTDGVSVEAAKWAGALDLLGFDVQRVAGVVDGPPSEGDIVVPELAIDGVGEPDPAVLESALAGADLVVVENLCSLPLNLAAARALTKTLAEHPRVVFRHHDVAWQRAEHAHVTELPPRIPGAVHVTINDHTRAELAERGIEAVVVRNHFDLDAPDGDRNATRSALVLDESDVLVLHPVRAIPRKNVPGAVELCEALAARLPERTVRYWLAGPAEDGYEAELEAVLDRARVPVLREQAPVIADAYAAADLVAFPSTWEGFGNPVVESVAARRPLAAGSYPALRELEALGLSFLPADRPAEVAAVLTGTVDLDPVLGANLALARRHLSIGLLPHRLARVFVEAGWR